MVYHGLIRNGQIVLNDKQARLPEGAAVQVDVISNGEPDARPPADMPTLYDALRPIIGIIDDLPEDASRNVDHYIYGHPKK